MTEQQKELVMTNIAKMADLDELKLIELSEIHKKIGIDSVGLQNILYSLAGEGYINELPKVINDFNKDEVVIKITHSGINKCLTSNQEKQINLVLTIIAEIAEDNIFKPVGFIEILEKADIDCDKLENIVIFLGKQDYIKNRHKVLKHGSAEIYITDTGIAKGRSFNQG
ncbi:hypothetical protein VB620_10070 [Nodularia harveyana UHCC-0300]|uniref:Uncharacterized protein n=1 Tax=Nodularia harveyana UHCC-0300 TaxID=2974287 RepID=A0ABU5UF32_9CYAN|nr:hypothetical protein [Nodularia harveyana]MEA5581685.1 hypothetical protein [Nodularia harveyana UHCC-0300]